MIACRAYRHYDRPSFCLYKTFCRTYQPLFVWYSNSSSGAPRIFSVYSNRVLYFKGVTYIMAKYDNYRLVSASRENRTPDFELQERCWYHLTMEAVLLKIMIRWNCCGYFVKLTYYHNNWLTFCIFSANKNRTCIPHVKGGCINRYTIAPKGYYFIKSKILYKARSKELNLEW